MPAPVPPAYRLLAQGRWSRSQVRCTRTRGRHRLPGHLEPDIAAAWTAACAVPGVHLFDGAMLRLDAWAVQGDDLALDLSETGYRDFLASNAAHPEWGDRYGDEALASPLGTSAALLSADGHLVFGVRSPAVALYPGHAHPFGGTMEPTARPDAFAETERELREEIGVGADDLASIEAIALIEDLRLRQVELVFLARCRLPLAALEARLDHGEHARLWTVAAERAGLDASLDGAQPLTAVTRATLVAAGRLLVGEEWMRARLAADAARGLRR